MFEFANEIFATIARAMMRENAADVMENCAEITNFICAALLQNNPGLAIDLRARLKELLSLWNTKFFESKNSIEPDGNLCILDTCRLVSILLGTSINTQLINYGRKGSQVAANGVKYNSLGTITELAESLNLSDLTSKVLDDDLSGSRLTSQLDPIIHNLAFGEKMFEESENLWNQLFQSAEGRDWAGSEKEAGGPKMRRMTRVLLAALLNHGRGESNQAQG